jgi:hypothetical protein
LSNKWNLYTVLFSRSKRLRSKCKYVFDRHTTRLGQRLKVVLVLFLLGAFTAKPRGLRGDVVYLSWPIEPLVYDPKCGGRGGVAGSQPVRTAMRITWHGAQINFGDLTPYLTYGKTLSQIFYIKNTRINALLQTRHNTKNFILSWLQAATIPIVSMGNHPLLIIKKTKDLLM